MIDKNSTWKELTPGGTIYDAGNAKEFKTGDWKSKKPVFHADKCMQCGMCFPFCTDDFILVEKEQKRGEFKLEYCKGCGICAKMCPFGAITMEDVE